MRRISAAAAAMPRMRAGRRSCPTWASGASRNSTNVETGRQPHQSAGRMTTSVASQNPGTESPITAALRAT